MEKVLSRREELRERDHQSFRLKIQAAVPAVSRKLALHLLIEHHLNTASRIVQGTMQYLQSKIRLVSER